MVFANAEDATAKENRRKTAVFTMVWIPENVPNFGI
jgi:hypothetical protein